VRGLQIGKPDYQFEHFQCIERNRIDNEKAELAALEEQVMTEEIPAAEPVPVTEVVADGV